MRRPVSSEICSPWRARSCACWPRIPSAISPTAALSAASTSASTSASSSRGVAAAAPPPPPPERLDALREQRALLARERAAFVIQRHVRGKVSQPAKLAARAAYWQHVGLEAERSAEKWQMPHAICVGVLDGAREPRVARACDVGSWD